MKTRPLNPSDAELLAKALCLLNDKPRFGPRDRRLPFDSYSLAADITVRLKQAHLDPQTMIQDLPRQ